MFPLIAAMLEFTHVIFQRQDGLGVNLADARFGQPERLGDFAQPQIFKIIKRQHFALHLGQPLQTVGDELRHLTPGHAVERVFLAWVGDGFVL